MTEIDALIKSLDVLPLKNTIIYLLEYDKKYYLINTKQALAKYVSNLKLRNKSIHGDLKFIINNNYTFNIIETYSYKSVTELNNRINELNILQQNSKKGFNEKLNNDLYNNSVKYEVELLPVLNKYFLNSNIINSPNRYSKYDFVDLNSKYIFELKTNTYSIWKHPNAVIPLHKLSYPFLILIFQYNEIKYNFINKKFDHFIETYFILYDENKFNTYNKRFITNFKTNVPCLILDIPTTELKKLNDNEHMQLEVAVNKKDFNYYLDLYNFIT